MYEYTIDKVGNDYFVLLDWEIIFKSNSEKKAIAYMHKRKTKDERGSDAMLELINDGFFFA